MTATSDEQKTHPQNATWFAVDTQGNIGRFESAQDGAVPNAAATMSDGESSFDAVALKAACVAKTITADSLGEKDPFVQPAKATRVLLALRSEEERAAVADKEIWDLEWTDLVEKAPTTVLREENPRVLITDASLAPELLRALAEHPFVALILDESQLSHRWSDASESMLYVFDHSEEGELWGPGAYARRAAPSVALNVSELPTSLAEAVGRVKFEVQFATADSLHLADHLRDDQCSSWSDAPLRIDPNAPRGVPPTIAGDAQAQRKSAKALVIGVSILLLFILISWLSRKPG